MRTSTHPTRTADSRAVGHGRKAQRAAQASEPTATTAQPRRNTVSSAPGGSTTLTAESTPIVAPIPAISQRSTGRSPRLRKKPIRH
ncbi:hypothetical protein [Mycolicibacterium vanbaalenii]|uniref:hypothetical protein n=1 Tax=Mycolicibacterium vanbaalenii TaxID=110539 RepID=UPI0021F333B6|nr:hypothetical protein [Mycolicibacterium vanbaalenii]